MTDGPDGCPWHEVAQREPARTIEVYDDRTGRYLGPATAEMLCDGWHLGIWLDGVITRALDGWEPPNK